MTWQRACGVCLLCALPARGADVWQRAKNQERPDERETLEALHRTLEGTSDSLDALLVRVSQVDFAKGRQYKDPLALVYVLRTRRLLGLPSLPGQARLLLSATEESASKEVATLGAIELALLFRQEGETDRAHAEFDRALGLAWRSDVRVEALLMRGWLSVEQGDLAGAGADFRAMLAFELGRVRLSLALASLSYVELLRGDLPEARRLYGRATELLSSGTTVSRSAFADRPELSRRDRAALRELERRLGGHSSE